MEDDLKKKEDDEAGEEVTTMDSEEVEGATTNSSQPPGAEDDDDDARPQATFSFTVDNFASLTDSVLSDATFVRNLPWKIMVMPRHITSANERGSSKCVGYFLQCNGESEASSWSCQAQAELRIINRKDPVNGTFTRKISHLFYTKENDWGFSHYMTWSEVIDVERGFMKNGSVTFEVKVTADAPHGVCWDSKKHTGFVGLKNQGATCYMNSLLQVLYFTKILCKAVYKMPTEADDSAKSVGLALQRVFHDLQFSDKAVGTKKLTKSFGWETLDSFMQHDVQEFLRVLLDKLEVEMKGTCVEGTIPKLFEGKFVSFIRCKHVDYTSSNTEPFYDLQLNIKGKKNLVESFRAYIKTESLDGENKYDAGPTHGLQDAEKGIIFSAFPPILHLHLMRFQYDPVTDSSVKFNDRFEFPEMLDLSEFIRQDADAMDVDGASADDCRYVLHAVLVHSGDNHGGHYVVFISPHGNGQWCKFDDDVVSRCTTEEAIQNNFGGADGDDVAVRQSTNAYMLVYIRKSALPEVLIDVTEADIPNELSERLNAEKQFEVAKRKEKNESHLYMTLRVILEDAFYGHQGNDLYDTDKATYAEVRLKKADLLRVVVGQLAEHLGYAVNRIRLWPLNHRTNQTFRPTMIDIDADWDKPIVDVADNISPWTVLVELADPMSEKDVPLPPFDKEQDVMLFFKFYDPARERIHYMGHMYVSITTKLSALVPELTKRAGLAADTSLMLFEEIKPNMLERVEDLDGPLEHVLEELMDGDILVFQKELASRGPQTTAGGETPQYRLPTCRDYFRDLFYRVDVTFVDKNAPSDSGFTLTLSQRTEFEQMVEAVARRLDVDPAHLQFFKTQNYREAPGHALKCTYDGTLKDLLVYFRPKQPKKMFYQLLAIPIHELENKRQIKCIFLSTDQKTEQEVTLYPNKNGVVSDLLEEAKQVLKLDGPLRLLDLISHKVYTINQPDARIETLSSTTTKSYRIEEVPADQISLTEDEMLVPVAHYQKEPYSTFGHPFLIKVRDGEPFEAVRERIREFLEVADKEFEKYRISVVVMGRPRYVDDEHIKTVKLNDFVIDQSHTTGQHAKPFIGLQHVNKNSKRARYNYMEKPIKIYN